MEPKPTPSQPASQQNPFRMGENHPKDERLRKNIEKLVQVCTDRLNKDANHSRALYIRASCLMRLGELDKALADCSSYLRILHREGLGVLSASDGLYLRGCIYQRKGQIKEAISDFTQVLESEPHHFNARLARASCYNYIGEFDLAIEDYEGGLRGDSARDKLNQSKRLRESRTNDEEVPQLKGRPVVTAKPQINSILAPLEADEADQQVMIGFEHHRKKLANKTRSNSKKVAGKPGEVLGNRPEKHTPTKGSNFKGMNASQQPGADLGRSPQDRSNSKGNSYTGLPFSANKPRNSATADLELSVHAEAEK